uniref:Radical SAM protein n=1 Tax=Strongyloides stercoralis TaxID=6248 RepID=A0A0K0ETS3_STRER
MSTFFFLGRIHLELNANYDGESSHCYRCFGGCCSTGTGSEALKLLRRELKDVAILQLSLKHGCSFVRVGRCCSTGAEL